MKFRIDILMVGALLVGCVLEQNNVLENNIVLSAPIVSSEGNVITWNQVSNAIEYEICINEKCITLSSDQNSYNVATNGYGNYEVKVRAKGENGYSYSPFSNSVEISVTQFAPEPILPQSIGDSLRNHPRLLFPKSYEGEIRKMIWTPEGRFLNVIHKEIERYSDMILNEEPYLKETLSSVRTSREILGRIFCLSYMYRMTELNRYAARAERELLAVAEHYYEWRPSHFLTTSEMTLAFAIGYDWLYDYLPESSKDIIVNEIMIKGLKASETASYRHSVGNWNSVCNACMIAAALAVFEHNPEKCESYVISAIQNNRKAVETFGPNGGYPEGYSYWHYGTIYQTMLFEVLKTAIGYESNLPDNTPGFNMTGAFPMMMATPSGGCYSYADVKIGANVSCASFWLAKYFDNPQWLYIDKNMILAEDFSQEDLLWRFNPCILIYSVGLDLSLITKPEKDFWYSDGSQPLFIWRSGFDDINDIYLGIKGGYPKQGHAHMDSGSFYYERDGVIWAGDLGGESYKIPNIADSKQDGVRWDIFRTSLASHNTISFDDEEHIVTAKASIIDYFTEDKKGAVVDLTSSCANKVHSAVRTIYFQDDQLNIIDNINPSVDTKVRWNMITKSEIYVESENRIILSSEEKAMALEIISPENAEIFTLPAAGNEGESINSGYIRLGFTANLQKDNDHELKVIIRPI